MTDEQRMQAYGALIEQLLNCPQGEEANILQNHSDLVDAGLLAMMEQVAEYLERQGNGNAQWLRGFATQLAETIGLELPVQRDLEVACQFLLETLQVIADKQGNPQQIYPVWSQQLTCLNLNLLETLPQVASQLYGDKAKSPDSIAQNLFVFGNLIADFSEGIRWLNLEIAITAYEQALRVQTCEAFPENWAKTQANLAIAYINRIRGDRAYNIEQSIQANKQALQVFTREAFPQDWARTQYNLAIGYSNRIQGDRAENIEKEIAHYELALQVCTREAFPESWARI